MVENRILHIGMKENSFQPTDQFRGKASSSSLETRIFDIVITRGKEVGLDDVSIIEINNHPLTLSQGLTCRRGMHLAERQPAWRHAFNASRGSKRWDDVTGQIQIRILFEENRADLYAFVADGDKTSRGFRAQGCSSKRTNPRCIFDEHSASKNLEKFCTNFLRGG